MILDFSDPFSNLEGATSPPKLLPQHLQLIEMSHYAQDKLEQKSTPVEDETDFRGNFRFRIFHLIPVPEWGKNRP